LVCSKHEDEGSNVIFKCQVTKTQVKHPQCIYEAGQTEHKQGFY